MSFRLILNEIRRKLVRDLEREGKQQEAVEMDEFMLKAEKIIAAKFGGKYISIPGNSKALAEERNQKIARDHNNGLTVPVIMERHGLSRAAVYKILKKQNEIFHPKK